MTETVLKSEKLKSRMALLWRGIFLLCAAALFLSIFIISVKINPARADGNRVIMLGFDGMDFGLTRKYMDQEELPNFSRLEEMGIISPLLSTFPPESPVAWSAMITGTNPGKTGIYDFLRRNPETYYPELNMTDTIKPVEFLFDTIPTGPPVLENARQGDPLWVYAANSGVNTVGIMMPMNMPPDEAPGSWVLSGLGVPDAAKTMGTYIFYVDDIE
ncbi:alkaline phosphatase family protein, partial [bacterium]|nr:alkaline phosphatase family protein [bacterium]